MCQLENLQSSFFQLMHPWFAEISSLSSIRLWRSFISQKKVSPLAVQTLDKVILEFNSPILRYLLNRRSKTAGCQIKICIKLESDANDIRSRSYHAEVYVKTKLTSLLASRAKS